MVAIVMGGRRPRMGSQVPGVASGGGGAGGGATSTLGAAGPLGWWDATAPANLLTAAGPATQLAGAAVLGVVNQVTGGVALATGQTVYGSSSIALGVDTPWRAVPHVNALLPGIGNIVGDGGINPYGLPWPILSMPSGLQTAAPIALAPGQAWWLALAWTRPNAKQRDQISIRPQSDKVMLAAHGTTPVLWLDNTYRSTVAGPDTGGLYVLGTKVVSTVPLRQCGTALLVNVPGVGVAVYLDGSSTAAATGIACTTSASDLLTLMLDPTDPFFGGSQCFFHEAAYGGALSTAQRTAALTSMQRFATGERPALRIVPSGQSNLGFVPGVAFDALRQAVAYYGGFVSVDFAGKAEAPGQPLYLPANSGSTTSSTYLTDAGIGTDPAIWLTGDTGATQLAAIAGLAPIHQPDVGFALSYYSEAITSPNISRNTYDTALPTFVAAYRRYVGLLRTAVGATAARLPFGATRGIGYLSSTPELLAMLADGLNQLAADAAFRGATVIYNGWDSNGRGGTSGSTGDSSHVSDTDHITGFRRAAGPVARLMAARAVLTLPSAGTPGGVAVTGPRIALAEFVDASGNTRSDVPTQTVRVTVTHDTGTALTLAGTANTGAGWAMHDGWTGVGARGASIVATACMVRSATTLLVTLASVPTAARSACRLTYCEGGLRIGTGNAVTDNASTIPAPVGFSIGSDLGPAFLIDYPLPSTPAGIAVT